MTMFLSGASGRSEFLGPPGTSWSLLKPHGASRFFIANHRVERSLTQIRPFQNFQATQTTIKPAKQASGRADNPQANSSKALWPSNGATGLPRAPRVRRAHPPTGSQGRLAGWPSPSAKRGWVCSPSCSRYCLFALCSAARPPRAQFQ